MPDNDGYFGPGYQPPTDPARAALDFQLLLLEAGAQIRDTIPAKDTSVRNDR